MVSNINNDDEENTEDNVSSIINTPPELKPEKKYNTMESIQTNAPAFFDSAFPIEMPYEDQYHEYFQGQTLKPNFPEDKEAVGTFESIKQGFNAVNDLSLIYNYQSTQAGMDNPLYDPVPPGWKPADDEDAFHGIDDIWKGYLLAATSPKDLKRRQYKALEYIQNEKRYENGSMLGHAIGLLTGGIVSPSTWIPLGAEIKAARLSQRLIERYP